MPVFESPIQKNTKKNKKRNQKKKQADKCPQDTKSLADFKQQHGDLLNSFFMEKNSITDNLVEALILGYNSGFGYKTGYIQKHNIILLYRDLISTRFKEIKFYEENGYTNTYIANTHKNCVFRLIYSLQKIEQSTVENFEINCLCCIGELTQPTHTHFLFNNGKISELQARLSMAFDNLCARVKETPHHMLLNSAYYV